MSDHDHTCNHTACNGNEVTLDDLCRMHHYFDNVKSKTETTKAIITTLETTILNIIHTINPTTQDTPNHG